jgi:hypothetical protein
MNPKSPSSDRENWKSFSPRSPRAEPPPPSCTRCDSTVVLTRIEPADPGYDLRFFHCPKCRNADRYLVRYQTTEAWVLVPESHSKPNRKRPDAQEVSPTPA